MNTYSIDVKLYGTAYIKADSAEEALKLAQELTHHEFEVLMDEGDLVYAAGDPSLLHLDEDAPTVSLSPIFTIHGPDAGDTPQEVE
jgi:hypothetical protein